MGMVHLRLAIVDLSAAGHQPMISASGRWVIAFNGEIYNHAELRQALQASGAAPAWRGQSDTETLLAGFEACGIEDTLRHCVGDVCVRTVGRGRAPTASGARSPRRKATHYGWAGDALVFGSELKALRAHPSWRGEGGSRCADAIFPPQLHSGALFDLQRRLEAAPWDMAHGFAGRRTPAPTFGTQRCIGPYLRQRRAVGKRRSRHGDAAALV